MEIKGKILKNMKRELSLEQIRRFAARVNANYSWQYTGVHFAQGMAEATDAHILIRVRYNYPQELEGKVIAKNGGEIRSVYPDFDKAIPNYTAQDSGYIEHEVDVEQLRRTCRLLVELGRSSEVYYGLRFGKTVFNPSLLLKAADMFAYLGSSLKLYLHADNRYSAAVMPFEAGLVVIMPIQSPSHVVDFGWDLTPMVELAQFRLDYLNHKLEDLRYIDNYKQYCERSKLVREISRMSRLVQEW